MPQKEFKAIVVEEAEPKKFVRNIKTRTIADLPDGDVLIRVQYSSLNYKDALSSSGNKGVTRNFPHTPGIDAAGVVEESTNSNFSVGEEVLVTGYDLGMNTSGGLGQYIRVPAGWVVKLPQGLSLKESMIFGTAGFTAALMVEGLVYNQVKPNNGPILVTGSTGGVGSVAVCILAKLGYHVVASTGKASEHDFLHSLGAKEIVDRNSIVDNSGKPLLKEQWAGVVDVVGGDTLASALKNTCYGGTVTCSGLVGSITLNTTVFPFILRGVKLVGIDSVECPMEPRLQVWKHLASDWKTDKLNALTTEITLEQVEATVLDMLDGKSHGRHVVNLG
ncbi:MAG: YhdH/YhfP family quinone oxidoreductase [SAR324 cluster bacterium]|nr:YhdH/YhfP family quinone oxidoreductase [SAR324 cluster bacterium]